MVKEITHLFSEISLLHLNVLFLLGLAIFGGTIGGRLFQKLRIPQVVGYVTVGILIGQSGIGIVDEHTVEVLRPFNYFALGLIGFMIGGELKKSTFAKYGKQLVYILLAEGLAAFLMVSLLTIVVGSLLLGNSPAIWGLGLLLGAIASATAPAATTDVLWEYKTRGPLTTIVLGIVAMDDGLALLLYSIASSVTESLVGRYHSALLTTFLRPIYEMGGAVVIGILSGLILSKILKTCGEQDRILAFSIGTVLLVLGGALVIHVDILLAAMSWGVTIVNYAPRKSKEIFKIVGRFTPPIYVLFFVLFGAKLNLRLMTLPTVLLAVVYLIGRTGGKAIGATFGARISGAAETVRKYLPLCLFSQAGVAIGLSILGGHRFPGEIGNAIVIIITATTFVVQIIGPPCTKLAVTKAGEVGLNITEEDLIAQAKAKDLMEEELPLVYEDMSLSEVLRIFSDSSNLYYPVVDADKHLVGVITIESIKNTLMTPDLKGLLLAHDLMEPVIATAKPETPMSEVKEIMDSNDLEYLPVVGEENRILGFLESRAIKRMVSRKIMELQKQVASLG